MFNPLGWVEDKIVGGISRGGGQLRKRLGDAIGEGGGVDNEFRDVDPNDLLGGQARRAGGFAGGGEIDYLKRGQALDETLDMLRQQATGERSVSAEQLRQGLQQNLAAQQSMAAGARPGNAAMAARNAAMQMGRMGSGLSGQQALAGLQEQNQAAQLLGQLQTQARQQELQRALESRQNAIQGYGAVEAQRGGRFGAIAGQPSTFDKILGAGSGIAQGWLIGRNPRSDRRAKTKIKREVEPEELLKSLKAYRFEYRNPEDGKGQQFGIMAQDLEKSRLGKGTVINTPQGKVIDAGKLTTALAAASASMHQRISKLEGKRK